jgi:hypothetical protein
MNNHDDYMDAIIRQYYNEAMINSFIKETTRIKHEQEEVKEPIPTIDQLLDQYNDYMTLHKMFGDYEYLKVAENTLHYLNKIC